MCIPEKLSIIIEDDITMLIYFKFNLYTFRNNLTSPSW